MKTWTWRNWYIWIYFFCLHAVRGNERAKRFLIFPRQAPTRHQFIAGIGIPADLDYESLTVGYVLKAQFFLPYNASTFRQTPYFQGHLSATRTLNAVSNNNEEDADRSQHFSSLRWQIFQYIEDRLEKSYGYRNGHECILRAICEASAVQFMNPASVYSQLLHIFFTPSTSHDKEIDLERKKYKMAEKLGRKNKNPTCNMFDCKFSILDYVSQIIV